jgi:GNAT superfamily N-acetyltransferase
MVRRAGDLGHLRPLFPSGLPVAVRCRAILSGDAAGQVLADPAIEPAYAFVQELADGTVYWGGAVTEPRLAEALATLRRDRAVVVGLWPGDPRRAWLPPQPDYEGEAVDFTDRDRAVPLDRLLAVPEGCELRAVDAALFERLPGRDWTVTMFGSADRALALGLGYCLLRDGEIVCEAFAGPQADGVIELGTGTAEAYRGRGYAAVACAYLIRACEARGYRPFWNAAAGNTASLALARKLGFRGERVFEVRAWDQAA